MKVKYLTVVMCCLGSASLGHTQGRVASPEDPVEKAKRAEVRRLIEDARTLARADKIDQAIFEMNRAASIESSLRSFSTGAKFEAAKLLTKAQRDTDALEAYRHIFTWDAKKNDLVSGAGRLPALDYAILLARNGKGVEAKAMYYFAMRDMNPFDDRGYEPIPFLTVFDPEPEGDSWEYSATRLEAAALMVKSNFGGSIDEPDPSAFIVRAHALWPDWFVPVMWQAGTLSVSNREESSRLLGQADALARQGLEKSLIADFRVSLAEHLAHNVTADTPGASDERPMKQGNECRARMQCLRPNVELLKSLILAS